ncbi:unnamed protein product, partial [Brenthis ino]
MEWVQMNGSVSDLLNKSDLFEVYKAKETQQVVIYKVVAYIFGTIIFLSNLTVVISSGLILRKGQQSKSTYLLLGNMSLADTIIGISIIFGAILENPMSSNPMCIFQTGMLVCPAMVSIFSVGLIAVDRYIYILHGLYYQRWFNTTKVRIGILCTWLICIILGFFPAVGWVNNELRHSRCYYVSLFPGALVLLNSLLSIVPIILVAVLYSIILVKALKNVKEIKASVKIVNTTNNKPELRIYRGNGHNKNNTQSVKVGILQNTGLKRSASFSGNCRKDLENLNSNNNLSHKFKSNDNLDIIITDQDNCVTFPTDQNNVPNQYTYESNISIYSINSSVPEQSDAENKKDLHKLNIENGKRKTLKKGPNKWRAIIIVMLTSGSFIFTWMPFFITVIFYVFCQEKLTNPKCIRFRMMLGGPIATLAFLNSILNPLIYAWWHKGFQRSIRMYFRKYIYRLFQKDVLR